MLTCAIDFWAHLSIGLTLASKRRVPIFQAVPPKCDSALGAIVMCVVFVYSWIPHLGSIRVPVEVPGWKL